MKKAAILGHFAFGLSMTDGQTVKTNTVAAALSDRYGEDRLLRSDTHGGLRTLLRLPVTLRRLLRQAEHVVILPAQRGVRVIAPLLVRINRRYHRGLHYCVIGGWLPELLQKSPRLLDALQAFDGIYAETETLRSALKRLGLRNVLLVPNCKRFSPAPADSCSVPSAPPWRLCTFSRVMREKGIEDAVEAVQSVNAQSEAPVFHLDIYGPVDPAQTDWFETLQKGFSESVHYRGIVPSERSSDALRGCYALLFPTRFFTEGIPGTVIDAYAAGVPVIASRWESFSDVIDDGRTGLGYAFADRQALTTLLAELRDVPERLLAMRENCLAQAERFQPEAALAPLFEKLGV